MKEIKIGKCLEATQLCSISKSELHGEKIISELHNHPSKQIHLK